MLTASNLFRASVTDVKNEKVGLVVNILFDYDSLRANLLVFPTKNMGIWERLTEFAKNTTLGYIKNNFPADYPKLLEEIANKGPEQVFKVLEDYLKEKKLDLLNIHYLIPLNQIEDPGNEHCKKVKMKEKIDETSYWCKPKSDCDYPFFGNRPFRGLATILSPTLHLPAMEGLKVTAPNGKKGEIVDLKLDYSGSAVDSLIVQTYGKGAGNYFVNPSDFDFSELRAKKMSQMQAVSNQT